MLYHIKLHILYYITVYYAIPDPALAPSEQVPTDLLPGGLHLGGQAADVGLAGAGLCSLDLTGSCEWLSKTWPPFGSPKNPGIQKREP